MSTQTEQFARNPSPRGASKPATHWLKRCAYILLPIVLIAAIASSFVFVDESEFVIVERLGRIAAVYDRPQDRGPHVKFPWPIDIVRSFDRRTQLFDPPGREIFTRDKKNVTVETYVCWRIAEPNAETELEPQLHPVVRFFSGCSGSIGIAETRLDNSLQSILSTRIGQVELNDLLHVDDSEAGPDAAATGRLETMAAELKQTLSHQPGEQSLQDRLGIEIVDVRIRRLNLPSGNQQAVFERMRSERRKIADRYRSAGMAENAVIKSQADRQYAEILAKASRQAEEIRGKAEAESIGILNTAHARDPELHRVLQTLDTYKTILNEKTTLVLSASSNLLKLLTDGVPNVSGEKPPVPETPSEAPKPPANEPAPKLSNAQQSKDRATEGIP